MTTTEETMKAHAAGHLELTDRTGTAWVPIRRDSFTRFAKRDTPVLHTQVFPRYDKLAEDRGPLTVSFGEYGERYPNLCPVFDAEGRTCSYGKGHSIQVHMLTASWAEPGPDNLAVYVNDGQLDENGGYIGWDLS